MNTFLATMAAVSALAIGTPAVAQYSNQQNGYSNNEYRNNAYANGNLSSRIGQLDARLQAGIQSGAITRREAMPLRQQLRHLTVIERQYSVNGMDGRERADLQQRIRTLRQQIRAADGGSQARWDGYDREDGYGRWDQGDRDAGYDRTSQYDRNDRLDRNNDGYDDRDYDRNGRFDEVDSRYQQPTRGGVGGIVDALLGTGGLRVGQGAPSNLYGVPNEYRDQFRDGNGAYYRTDGRQIYQIDSRTQMVVRVYAMNR